MEVDQCETGLWQSSASATVPKKRIWDPTQQEGPAWLWPSFYKGNVYVVLVKREWAEKLRTSCPGGLVWGTVLWPRCLMAACSVGLGNSSPELPLLYLRLWALSGSSLSSLISCLMSAPCRTKEAFFIISGCRLLSGHVQEDSLETKNRTAICAQVCLLFITPHFSLGQGLPQADLKLKNFVLALVHGHMCVHLYRERREGEILVGTIIPLEKSIFLFWWE